MIIYWAWFQAISCINILVFLLTEKHFSDTKEQFDAFIKKHDEKQAKEVNNLTLQHKSEAIRVEKIHKSEKFTHKRKEMKENHDMYKKIKKEAHENQFAGFELYQRNELADQMKVIEGKKADQLAKLIAEVKDKDELAEKKRQLDERCEREINNQSNKLAKNQEIRREQVVAEHKEQMKLMDQVYLKRIKEFDEDTQSEIERLENEIQAIGFIEQWWEETDKYIRTYECHVMPIYGQ